MEQKADRVQIPVCTSGKETMKKNKYNNNKIEMNGIVYDSKKEMQRHQQLLLKQEAGAIKDLQTQVKYILIPAQYETVTRYGKRGQRLKDGKKLLEREISYVADFVYYDVEQDKIVVEDVKSKITRENKFYIAKRKMLLYFYGIRIKEI